MKVGRNDPCPCGSGKKYKKCCMAKDQAAAPEREPPPPLKHKAALAASPMDIVSPSPPAPSPPAPEDPLATARNARWEEFEQQDYEGRIALFLQTLHQPELMDAEQAMEMLEMLFSPCAQRQQRDRFDALQDALAQQLPDVYQEGLAYHLHMRISNALAMGRRERAAVLMRELAPLAGKHIDTFMNVLDALAYHGMLPSLLETVRTAWPLVKQSDDVVPWAVDELADLAAAYETFDYVERHPGAAVTPELLDRLRRYFEPIEELTRSYVDHLTGRAGRHWTLADFAAQHAPKRRGGDDADIERPLVDLGSEFIGYLRRDAGVPYEKGQMAKKHILLYIEDRRSGELDDNRALIERMIYPQKKPKRPPRPANSLCPDRTTLDAYLAGLLGILNPQIYEAAATLEMIPHWLRFLESRELLDAAQREATMASLAPLVPDMLAMVRRPAEDPALAAALEQWEQLPPAHAQSVAEQAQ